MDSNGWYDAVKTKPERDQHGESDMVLAYTAKFGKRNGCVELLWYNHTAKRWESDLIDDYENNADYYLVTHWRPLPKDPESITDILKKL